MRQITVQGRQWLVEATGFSHQVDFHDSRQVRFLCKETGEDLYGSISGLSIEQVSDQLLADALRAVLYPTKSGDILVFQKDSLYAVGVVIDDGNRTGYDNKVLGLQEAGEHARNWSKETGGRVFLIDAAGDWTQL
jgi:hypothetical protein